jgi:hypothetical protein
MKKTLLAITIGIALLGGGFFALNSYIYNQKQGDNTQNVVPYQGTLTGTYVCLPHTNQKGPQTLECALGLKTDTGEYYALDFNAVPQSQFSLKMGDRFTMTGLITPVQMLSTDQWRKYPIEGILSLSEPAKKL